VYYQENTINFDNNLSKKKNLGVRQSYFYMIGSRNRNFVIIWRLVKPIPINENNKTLNVFLCVQLEAIKTDDD